MSDIPDPEGAMGEKVPHHGYYDQDCLPHIDDHPLPISEETSNVTITITPIDTKDEG